MPFVQEQKNYQPAITDEEKIIYDLFEIQIISSKIFPERVFAYSLDKFKWLLMRFFAILYTTYWYITPPGWNNFSFYAYLQTRTELTYLHPSNSYHEDIDLSLIADGDEKAFYNFYSHYSNLLRPFLLQYTRSQNDVEDIIQETFIRVWLNRDRLHEIENLGGWLYRIASRVYLDHLDRNIKRQERKAAFGESMYGSGQVVSLERTHLHELHHIIQQILDNLTEKKKQVFRLNREMAMKPAQIAAQLNMPVGTVKNQLSATLREIRDQLAAAGYGPLSIMYLLSILF